MSYLRIENLKKSFGSNPILKGVDLSVQKGEFVSLLGPSGSGKTTILRCVAGLETPDLASGSIVLDGRVLSGPKDRVVRPEDRNLGMVFQNYAVWPHMNVEKNVAFPLEIRKSTNGFANKSEVASRVRWALDLVKLTPLANRFAHELSGGQQQRVALARALAMSPKALLLDEPLSNLDALLREELGSEIRRLQQELGLTTILVTHDQKEALSLSDRIVLLDRGRIDTEGVPEELFKTPPTEFAAAFIAGAQKLVLEGRETMVLPRNWSLRSAGEPGLDFKITSRLFLGSEYEYSATGPVASAPIRFFSHVRFEPKEAVRLIYRAN